MELTEYFRILRKRWWLILLVTLLGTGIAAYRQPDYVPVYRSTVTLLLSPGMNSSTMLPMSLSERTNELAQTYSIYLKTRAFADQVIAREELSISANELISSIQTRIVEGTQFFEITATSGTPEGAQELATAIANNFIELNISQQQEDIDRRRAVGDLGNMQAFLRERLERERAYYDDLVTNLRSQITQLGEQPPSLARDDRIFELQEQLADYEARLLQVMSDLVAIQPELNESQLNTVSIVEPAQLPTSPINSQNTLRNLLFAVAASLVVGIVLAFGLAYLDFTVHRPVDLERLMMQRLIGVIGRFPDRQPLIVLEKPYAAASEAFRALRTNLQFSQPAEGLRSLVVTSAEAGEGKTTVAANLAVAMALSGRHVILVDADLRNPHLHQIFELASEQGLSDLLTQRYVPDATGFQQWLQPGPLDTLRILTSGPQSRHSPAELFSTVGAGAVFEVLETLADYVIYDTPPALTVADALILANRSNATLQVVKAGATHRDLVLRCRQALEGVGVAHVGLVLNAVKEADMRYAYGYGYGAGFPAGRALPLHANGVYTANGAGEQTVPQTRHPN